MHCGRYHRRAADSPRDAAALRQRLRRASPSPPCWPRPTTAPAAGLHHPAKARSVIFLYMDGGPSQVDTFDPKPLLDKYHGRDPHSVFKVEPTQFNNVGKVLASPWKFQQHGQSGLPVSDLFPHVAECVDDLCVVRSMVSKFSEHTSANYFLHTGSGMPGPAEHGGVGQLRPGQREPRTCPASSSSTAA